MHARIRATALGGAMIGIVLLAAARVGSSSATRSAAPSPDALTACASCHPDEWSEWQASRHAQAWRDPIFQAEFAHGRQAWCVGCHAPSAPDPTAPDDADPQVAQGVGCDACHQRDGRMVSARRALGSPHDTRVDPSFGTPDFCARCHEFKFPILGERGRLVRYTDEVMQATVSEWRRTERTTTCLDCHADGATGHRFRGSHDAERVAAALASTVCRGRGTLEVELENVGAGHNVPSGGVHRRMVLRAWRSTAPERLAEHTLGRTFRPLVGGGKQTIDDTTIPPGAVHRARFVLGDLGPATSDSAVNLELRYIYALDERLELGTPASQVIWHRRVVPAELARCTAP